MVRTSSLRLFFSTTLLIASALAGCTTDFDISNLPHRDGGADANDVTMTDGGMDGMDGADGMDASDVPADMPIDSPAEAGDAPDATDGSSCGVCAPTETCCAGSCVDLDHSVDHCGSCDTACTGTACESGHCGTACVIPFLNCDDNIFNGCEVNAGSDATNCGACGRACAPFQDCVGGSCACSMGRSDCDGMVANGCEVDTVSDPRNCGGCNMFCAAGQGCAMGACTCLPGFEDCDGIAANGCEVDTTTDAANCGSCRMRCGPNAVCMGGACQCSAGFLSCGTSFDCSTSATDPNNCGTCGTVCPAATPVCGSAGCNTGCTGSETLCGSSCVDTDTSVSNCGTCGTTCTVSAMAPTGSTTAVCNAGTCGIQCAAGFADCNNDPSDGCEVDTRTSTANCGACGTACLGAQICASGACGCATGLRDCGGGVCSTCCSNADCGDGDACTTDVCTGGTCGHSMCSGSTSACCGASGCNQCCTNSDCDSFGANRACAPDFTCSLCRAGFADCDGNPTNGCEADLGTLTTCGACGVACGFANATALCTAGACALGACNPGYGNCDGNAANGCETNLGLDNNNCGACGTRCTAMDNVCISGVCGVSTCMMGRADCDGVSGNGCEADLSSPATCGSCTTTCSLPNATAACTGFQCTIASCNAGFGDCDGNAANGCETSLNSDPAHCGTCATSCTYSNGVGTCSSGTCTLGPCNPGFANCNGSMIDGCEIDLRSNLANCGACNNVCPGRPNAATVCAAGSCTYSCNPGSVDCNGSPTDGCEIANATDVNNCGLCANSCGSPTNATRSCAGGSCSYACTGSFANCDMAPGCETDLSTSATNCGACGIICHGAFHARGVCGASAGGPTCGLSCEAGWADCDGNPANGCEVNTASDQNNCGSCGAGCGILACLNGGCSALGCGGLTGCSGDCVNTSTDRRNCGSCGRACGNNEACTGGTCTMITCSSSATPNPCGGVCTNTNTDAANCGTCGRTCALNQTCVAGACQSWADSCTRAVAISLTSGPSVFDVSFAGQTNSGVCSGGPDVYRAFYLAQQEIVYADTFASMSGAPPAQLAFVADCTSPSPTCQMASCSTTQAQTTAVLGAGWHYLIVDAGTSTPSGTPVRVTFQHVPIANPGSGAPLASGPFTLRGTTMGTTSSGSCGRGPDVGYAWTTCPSFATAPFTASLCGGASYDTVLQLVNGSSVGGGCNDNAFTCSPQSSLTATVPAGAGLHVFFVDGATTSSAGMFTVTGNRP